jgi:hypothetical protein
MVALMAKAKVQLQFDVWRDKDGRIFMSCDDKRLVGKGFVVAISERMTKVHSQLSALLAQYEA